MPLPISIYCLLAAAVLVAAGLVWLPVGGLAVGLAFEVTRFFVGGAVAEELPDPDEVPPQELSDGSR